MKTEKRAPDLPAQRPRVRAVAEAEAMTWAAETRM